MLSKFSVENFKCFEKKVTFDFAANEYQFNNNIIKNNLVNTALIYGKNGVGKTNIGLALFDILFHLTDYDRNMIKSYKSYLNLNSKCDFATFEYEFKFDKSKLIYIYKKKDVFNVIYEKLIYNDEVIIEYDKSNPNNKIIKIEEANTLNLKNMNDDISLLKYVANNTILNKNHPLSELMNFVKGMLLFRDNEGNSFIGIKSNVEYLNDTIVKNGELLNFEKFLKEHGINYKLESLKENEINMIYVKFKNGSVPFETVASTGTKSLRLFYCWKIQFSKIKFLFIDEFNSNYHFELSSQIVKELNELSDIQIVLTTNNTYLMSNKISRPDCTFIISNNKIVSLTNSTEKELREAHNIEKLYREGQFTD